MYLNILHLTAEQKFQDWISNYNLLNASCVKFIVQPKNSSTLK